MPDYPKIANNRVLVTGGAGFIGSNLCEDLLKYDNEVVCITLNYGLETIGLRYFNVYGRRQDPNGAYAAVIPKFTMMLMAHESPVIHGDGAHSRDFTYIDNVIKMNYLAVLTSNPDALNQIFNTAAGERNDLNQMASLLKKYLAEFDPEIQHIPITHGPDRKGDIPHSLASIEKAIDKLGYKPEFNFEKGLKLAVEWYWENLK